MICSCLAVSRSWFLVSRWVRTTAPNEKRETRNVLHFLPFLLTIHLSVRLLLRVLNPRVGWPQGVTGCRPPDVLPSPPPCGWSTGFIDTPRLCGRFPTQRVRPALPHVTFSWSVLPTCPIVAKQSSSTLRVSPEGNFTSP